MSALVDLPLRVLLFVGFGLVGLVLVLGMAVELSARSRERRKRERQRREYWGYE